MEAYRGQTEQEGCRGPHTDGPDKLPFDPCDFFGYLASGLLVLIGGQYTFGFPKVIGADLKLIEVGGGIVLLMTYVAGQIIAGPSRFILETLAVGKLLKRPNINLFREKGAWVRWPMFPGCDERLPKEIGDNNWLGSRCFDVTASRTPFRSEQPAA